MGTPTGPIPRRFYRVAYQRFEEAEVLMRAGYHIGAVYLAGYSVECMLKALILDSTPERQHVLVESEFRGRRAHDFESLRMQYANTGAPQLPVSVNDSLVFVSTWETSLRYTPGMGRPSDSRRFLVEVNAIIDWADNRI